jgi:protein MpaA
MPSQIRLSYLAVAGYLTFIGLTIAFVLANPTPAQSGCIETITVGKSNMGFDIELCHVGGSHFGSKNSLLVIGSIHGNEPAGKKVVDELLKLGAGENTDIWVIRDANPDGSLRATRQNFNRVDLNRNFPTNWLPSKVGAKTYSGTNPASEPETHALMKALDLVKPATLITIHQPYGLVDCSKGKDQNLDERLAALTGLPATCIPGEMADSPTNTYTGTITLWFNNRYPDATAVALELGGQVSLQQISTYAKALKAIPVPL